MVVAEQRLRMIESALECMRDRYKRARSVAGSLGSVMREEDSPDDISPVFICVVTLENLFKTF